MKNTRKCQYCGKRFSKNMRFCPFCAGEHKMEVTIKTALCPSCKTKLKVRRYRGVEINVCPRCEGIWLDTEKFRRVSSERDTYQDEKILYRYVKKGLKRGEGYRACVRCGVLMYKRNFKKISGVVIDVCNDHGIWLDKGELDQIRCFIANGGLEKYQEFLDHRISYNHNQIRKIAGSLHNIEFMQKMMNLYNPKYWLLRFTR